MKGASTQGERSKGRAETGRAASSPGALWLLYGAYGFTGRLLAREALRRGHRPVLAGRRSEKLRDLANELEEDFDLRTSLEVRTIELDDPESLRRGLEGVAAVLHAAGPFRWTGTPMMDACLEHGVHYLDITGEVPVFEAAFERSERARTRQLVFMPGVGMDVIPTDTAAALVAREVPRARRLDLALHSPGRASTGTLRTIVDGISDGLLVRRNGALVRRSPGRREFRRWVDLGPESEGGPMGGKLGGRRSVAPYTWGDLSTAWRTTGIPDITCYMTTARRQVRVLPFVLPVLRVLLSWSPIRALVRSLVDRRPDGPSSMERETGRCRVWGRAADEAGRGSEVVLEFPEAYRFTAEAGVRAVHEVLTRTIGSGSGERLEPGTLTPAGAFGPEWGLGLPGVRVVRGPTDLR